jgi:hypothetical protein
LDSTQRDREEAANAVELHAALLTAREPTVAVQLFGAAQHLRGDHPRSPAVTAATRAAEEGCAARLGAAGFRRLHRRGAALDTAALVELLDAIEQGH